MRSVSMYEKMTELLKAVPFRPFMVNFENGQQVTVDHPENVAYAPRVNGHKRKKGRRDLYIMARNLSVHSTFDAITAIVQRN
jgi:hypothetical protein